MKLLIYDLLLTEAWKEKVYPILKSQFAKVSSIRSYMAIYHEATLTNILEVFLYHRTATEACEEAIVELIDYCYRKFVRMNQEYEKMPDEERNKGPALQTAKDMANEDYLQELDRQYKDIEFNCCMTCISLIRFITDHMEALPASIIHALMDTADLPLQLVPLMEFKPWIRENHKGKQEKWEDNKWQEIQPHDKGRVTKIEGQIWLTIYNMFMTQASNQKYELTTFRKGNLLRLKKYMNEVLLD